jgi:uncharacterized membrane protein
LAGRQLGIGVESACDGAAADRFRRRKNSGPAFALGAHATGEGCSFPFLFIAFGGFFVLALFFGALFLVFIAALGVVLIGLIGAANELAVLVPLVFGFLFFFLNV